MLQNNITIVKNTSQNVFIFCSRHYLFLQRSGFPCNGTLVEDVPSLVAPGYRAHPPACILQTQVLLFSCAATSPSTSRLCPCRDYIKGQVALCDKCQLGEDMYEGNEEMNALSIPPYCNQIQTQHKFFLVLFSFHFILLCIRY